jgi:tetratricopeptide (TPR) repeat protein
MLDRQTSKESAMRRLLLLVPLLFTACATHGIRVPVLKPAAIDLVQFDRVAVDRLEGDGCEPFGRELAKALRDAQNPLTGQTAFSVQHREEVDRALDQLRDRHGDDWDKQTMAVLDRWRTAQIVLGGHFEDHRVEEELVQDHVVDSYGHKHVLWTRRAAAHFRVRLQASDVAGKREYDAATLHGSSSSCTRSDRGEPAPIDHGALLAEARAQAVQQYLDRVLPRQVWVQVALYQNSDVPDLQLGNGYAESGNWAGAVESYQRALAAMTGELAAYRYQALFNLGVAYEFTDQFAPARQALQEAYALGQESMILEELQRVDHREREVQRLRAQGGEPAQPSLPSPAR